MAKTVDRIAVLTAVNAAHTKLVAALKAAGISAVKAESTVRSALNPVRGKL